MPTGFSAACGNRRGQATGESPAEAFRAIEGLTVTEVLGHFVPGDNESGGGSADGRP